MKIDFHTHILPQIDDGANTLNVSLDMLQLLEAQHVDTVVLTPHYYSHRKPLDEFLAQREEAYEKLIAAYNGNITLHLGAEVYFSDYLFNNCDLSPLCIRGTRSILIELPYNKKIERGTVEKIDRLIAEYAVTPILAHIERYPSLIKSSAVLDRLMDIGCVFQTNLSSYTAFGKRRLIRLVNDGCIGALGTDAHNTDSRAPAYDKGYDYLRKTVSRAYIEEIQVSMAELLNIR